LYGQTRREVKGDETVLILAADGPNNYSYIHGGQMNQLMGRTAIVTGGTGALGRAVTFELLTRGANVMCTYLKDEELAQLVKWILEGAKAQ